MLTIRRGDSEVIDLSIALDLTGVDALTFTAKASVDDDDGDAILQKVLGDGVTITDEENGTAEVAIDAADLDAVEGGTRLVYDVQLERAGTVRTISMGTLLVLPDVTRAREGAS